MLHNSTLVIGGCDPCSAFPSYFYLSPQPVSFTSNSSSDATSSVSLKNTDKNDNVNADKVDVL